MKKRILAITGIRSEYDLMCPVYKAIESNLGLSLSLVVTGAHLSKAYGYTVDQIKKDGFEIAEQIESLVNGDRDVSRLIGLSTQLQALARTVDRIRPDVLLVFGDREESITTAIVGSYLNIPVCHISGGDRVIGNVDDHVRHAVTKLSHIHLTTSEESKTRIIKMGEQPFRVHNVGHPGLDRLVATEKMDKNDLLRWYGFEEKNFNKPLLLVIQHVISTEIDQAYAQMKFTMEALDALSYNTVISFPNSDAGSADIIRCIHEYERRPFIKTFYNIPRKEFVNTMRHASCMLGNSSSGLMEAPFLKLPVVNIGNRQKARMHAENVEFVPHDSAVIKLAVEKACNNAAYRARVAACSSPYGDGKTAQRIATILAEMQCDDTLLLKDITY